MKKRTIYRMIALLLALLMLVPLAATAEEVELEVLESNDIGNDPGIEIAGDALEDVELVESVEDIAIAEETDAIALYELASDLDYLTVEQETKTTKLTLGVGEKYTLDAQAIGSGKKVTYKTSKKSVATVSSKGVIKGVKEGSATISCYVSGAKVAAYKVTVVKAPGKVTLNKTAVTLMVKNTFTLKPTIPSGTHASFTWSSKDKTIASVSGSGKVTAKKAGKTTITVKTQNGKTAKATITVMKAPDKVTLNKTSATLKVKETLQLKATVPKNTYDKITWSSSDKSIAKVSSAGKVTAVSAGKAKITAKTANGKKATCTVTVKSTGSDGKVKYRALLIGEENFSYDTATRNRGDVGLMSEMLASVKGLYGGSFAVTKKYNLNRSGVLSAIKSAFGSADNDDVSLFFIATHGDVDSSGSYAGALSMSPSGDLLLKDLASALQAVPGKIIVILESCGAGAAVYANGKSNKITYDQAKQNATALDAAIIRAFSEVDSGIEVELEANDVDSSGLRTNTGEFRVENKFYVLAASRYQELSWGMESPTWDAYYNYFTKWLTEGIGTYGKMPADTNSNGQTTLNELYKYISKVGDNEAFRVDGEVYYQHVQVYPSNCSFVLFKR